MMTKNFVYLLSCYLAVISTSVWSDSYYCTNTGQVVSTGATLDAVVQACGNPNKMETKETQEPIDRQTQIQWVYFAGKNAAPWDNKITPELTVSFFNEQVVSIEVNGQAVQGGIDCFRRGVIQVGDTRAKVAMVCGKPDTFQRNRKTIMGPEQTTVQATYERGNGLSPVIFEFKANKLTAIRYGS